MDEFGVWGSRVKGYICMYVCMYVYMMYMYM